MFLREINFKLSDLTEYDRLSLQMSGECGLCDKPLTYYEITNLDLTGLILSNLDLTSDRIEFVKDRLGHDRRYSLESKKIESLGWRPQYSFSKSLGITIEWYKDNRLWWERIK